MCNNWPDFPNSVATGGVIGDTVIICGGSDGEYGSAVDECYTLTSEKRTFVTHMYFARWYAASIVLNDNTLWVTGGRFGGEYLASTEYVTVTAAHHGFLQH